MSARARPRRPAIASSPPAQAGPAPRWRARLRLVAGLLLGTFAMLGAGTARPAWARPAVPAEAPAAAPPAGPAAVPEGEGPRGGPRGPWRNLSPAQREAIRQLSREQREALAGRPGGRPGAGNAAPGARLTPRERRELRAVIREEHERRGGRGGGKRP